jgi:uncharacterized repeat protein (TIGR01451 family)
MRSTSKKNILFRFPWILFLCLGLWTSIGLFPPQAGSAALPNPDAVDDSADVEEDGNVTIDVLTGDDPGTVPVTITSVTDPPNGNAVVNDNSTPGDPGDDLIDYTPATNFFGLDTFNYTITDADGDTATVAVSVTPVNDAPIGISLSNTGVDENRPFGTVVGTLTTTDVDISDSHTYTLVAGAGDNNNLSFQIVGDSLQTNEVFDFETRSSYSIRVRTEDQNGGAYDKEFIIGVNDHKKITLEWDANNEPDLAGYRIYQSDTSAGNNPDSDDPVIVINVDLEDDANYVRVDLNFDNSRAWFWVVVAYGSEGLASDPSYEVSNKNKTPTDISLSQQSLNENEPIGKLIGDFSTEDPDIGNSHIYTLVAGTGDDENSSFTIEGSNLFTSESSNYEEKSSYSIRVQTNDQNGDYGGESTVEIAFVITVNDVNDAPVAVDDAQLHVNEDSADNSLDVLANDTDVDVGDTKTISAVGAPDHGGTVVLSGAGAGNTVLYTPVAGFVGTETFSYTMSDGACLSDTGAMTVTVDNVNDAPVAADDAYSVDEDTTLSRSAPGVLANDSDADGEGLTAVPDTQPGHGVLTLRADGSFDYTPDADFNGTDSFTYYASDGKADSSTATVTITLPGVNDAPTISGEPAAIVEEGMLYSFTPTAQGPDIEEVTLNFSILNQPNWASFDTNTGSLTGMPGSEDVGITTAIVITVTDGSRSASLPAFDIEVINVNTDLAVQMTVDNSAPNVGDDVVFTLTVSSHDSSDTTDVMLIDILPLGLTYNSNTPSQGTYDDYSGVWDIGLHTSGESVTLDIAATVKQPGRIANIASLTNSDLAELDSSDNSCGIVLNGGIQADLAIEKKVDNPIPNVGDTIAFTVRVKNNGLDDATGVQVKDILPPELTHELSTFSQGNYDPHTGVWDIADLGVGASAILQLTVTINNTNEIITTAGIPHSDQLDPDKTNNQSSAVINPNAAFPPVIADLAIQNIVNQGEVIVGENLVFTVVVRNLGPDDASDVLIDDLMPAGIRLISSQPSQGAYNEITGEWEAGVIGVGSHAMLDITAEVTDAGLHTIIAGIGHLSEFDPNQTNDDDEAIVSGQTTDLSVLKTIASKAVLSRWMIYKTG